MIIQIFRFRSGLSRDEVDRHFQERAGRYREVLRLKQKYYVRFPATGEYRGIYVWDSRESLDAWRAGDLSGTLSGTYQVQGEPSRELAEVMLALYDG